MMRVCPRATPSDHRCFVPRDPRWADTLCPDSCLRSARRRTRCQSRALHFGTWPPFQDICYQLSGRHAWRAQRGSPGIVAPPETHHFSVEAMLGMGLRPSIRFRCGGWGDYGDILNSKASGCPRLLELSGDAGNKAILPQDLGNTHGSTHSAGLTTYTRVLRPSGRRFLWVNRPSPATSIAPASTSALATVSLSKPAHSSRLNTSVSM